MNKAELKMKYKTETSFSAEEVDCFARVGFRGDVILDGFGLDDAWIEKVRQTQCVTIPDPDYVNWLEETLMRLL